MHGNKMQIMYLPFFKYNVNCNSFRYYLFLHHLIFFVSHSHALPFLPQYQWLCITMTQFSSHFSNQSLTAFYTFTVYYSMVCFVGNKSNTIKFFNSNATSFFHICISGCSTSIFPPLAISNVPIWKSVIN